MGLWDYTKLSVECTQNWPKVGKDQGESRRMSGKMGWREAHIQAGSSQYSWQAELSA